MIQPVIFRSSQNVPSPLCASRTHLGHVSFAPPWAKRYHTLVFPIFSICKSTVASYPMKSRLRHFSTGAVTPLQENTWHSSKRFVQCVMGLIATATGLAWKADNKKRTELDRAGDNFFDSGQYKEALECYLKALAMLEKEFFPDQKDLAMSYASVGICLGYLGKMGESQNYINKYLKTREKLLPSNHPVLIRTYHDVESEFRFTRETREATR